MPPKISTFVKSINNNYFISWPRSIATLMLKYVPNFIATVQCYLVSEKQGIKSTKNKLNFTYDEIPNEDSDEDLFPSSDTPDAKTHHVFCTLIEPGENSTTYIDLTGRLPRRSVSVNRHVLSGFHFDSNCTCRVPLKDRK